MKLSEPELSEIINQSLKSIKSSKWALIKPRPISLINTDFDILCESPLLVIKDIEGFLRLSPGAIFKTKKTYRPDSEHIHLDLYYENSFVFRYDLYSASSLEKSCSLREGYLTSSLENVEEKDNLYCLSPQFEIAVLAGEYLSLFSDFPSKYKHFDYLIRKYDEDLIFDAFHKAICQVTLEQRKYNSLRKKVIKSFLPSGYFYFRDILNYIKTYGALGFLKAVKKRVFR